MMSHLKDQAAIVTGGGSGIGLAIARAVFSEGMKVAIAGRDEAKLKRTAADLGGRADSKRVIAVPTDISVASQVDRLINETVKAFGRIDLLVNNAGIGQWASVTDCTEAEWDKVQAINLKGAFLCARGVFPIMKQQGSGYIVNLASLAGKMGFGGMSAYSASKFGMVGLTQSLLEEGIADNIRATVICPGYVATVMVENAGVPAQEMIPAEDIGRLVVGLLHLSPVTVIKEIVVERKGSIGT
jgi:3-oxoacyl-[acyl-carrier protein] reductase